MFPYKSNAFHAYEPKRNPLKSRTFASLIAIAMLLVVLAFSEARAEVVTYAQCESVKDSIISGFQGLEIFEEAMEREKDDYDRVGELVKHYYEMRKGVAEWATIYDALCKD